MQHGRSLKLFLVDGNPSGVITAELGVSAVKAVVASRTALPELIARSEASSTGVYLLLGPDPEMPGRNLVYVGEGDNVRMRIAEHDADAKKDWFARAVLVVSKDENLTKAHARFLEARIIATVRDSGRARLTNVTEPRIQGLPEAEIADMERVLGEVEILLPVLGFDVLRPAGRPAVPSGPASAAAPGSDVFWVFKEAGTNARAYESGGEFVVTKGSMAKAQEVPSCDPGLKRRRAELLADGVLARSPDPRFLEFTKDTAFDSPSGAAGVVYGGNASGPQYWKREVTGQTYKDYRARQLHARSAGNVG